MLATVRQLLLTSSQANLVSEFYNRKSMTSIRDSMKITQVINPMQFEITCNTNLVYESAISRSD